MAVRGPAALAKLTEDQFIRASAGIVPKELWVTAQREVRCAVADGLGGSFGVGWWQARHNGRQ
jgi:hypothetical protein